MCWGDSDADFSLTITIPPSIITGVPRHITLLNHWSILSPVSLHYPVNSLYKQNHLPQKTDLLTGSLLPTRKSKLLIVDTIRHDTACTYLNRLAVHQSLTQPNVPGSTQILTTNPQETLPCVCSQSIICLKHLLLPFLLITPVHSKTQVKGWGELGEWLTYIHYYV